MKTVKKVLIAVGAVVLAAAVIVGVLFAVNSRKVPDLKKEMLHQNPINDSTVYTVGQPPYSDRLVFDTPDGMDTYWNWYHIGGNGLELVLQQSKDGQLIVLSEPLPGKSNADDLYGNDVQTGDLTLGELQKINLAYDFVDEDGFQSYVGMTGNLLPQVSVVTLDEALRYFSAPTRLTVKLFLRFYDESQITDLSAALQAIYDGLKANALESNAVFCPQSDASAIEADAVCPDLARAATAAEARALYRSAKRGKAQQSLPYSTIYEKADARFGSEKFIHYARNLGLAVVLTDVQADDALRLSGYGVTALASGDPAAIIHLLRDAESEAWESPQADD